VRVIFMRTKTGNKDQRILNAAVAIFARDGYHHSRISDIAEQAGISVGSVYLYFENKESILNRLFSDLWARFAEQLEFQYRRQELSAVEKLEVMIDLIFNGFVHHADLAVVFVNEQNFLLEHGRPDFVKHYEAYLRMGTQIVREGIKQGVFRPDVDLLVLRHFTFGGIRHLIHLWAHDPKRFPLLQMRAGIKELVKNSIRAAR